MLHKSEQEKHLLKQYRKEEKKMGKMRADTEEDAALRAKGFDPVYLRARRYLWFRMNTV